MKERIKDRHVQILAVFFVLAIVLIVRLFIVTVVEHGSWQEIADGMTTKTTYTSGTRGEIYDRYGRLLAGNKQSFTVKMTSSGQTEEELNESIIKLVDILDENGDRIISNFPIKKYGNKYEFTFEKKIKKWLRSKKFNTDLTTEQAFEALRTRLEIDPNLDRYEAQAIMQTEHNQYPPISVKSMKYTAEIEKEEFLQSYSLDEDVSAKEAFKLIRESLGVPKAASAARAMKIMTVRNSINDLGYNKYLSATIAKNVSDETVMRIEEENEILAGVDIVSETKRYYPHGSTASHILGYLGKISDDSWSDYEDAGYEKTDLAGLDGIEATYESVLRGSNGKRILQVNAYGDTEQIVEETEPKKGKDVYLTIDLELQKKSEDALRNGISALRYGGALGTKYGISPTSAAAPKAETGAVVAIEVDTGDVIAMASYPDYNPNLFSEGISDKDWDRLQSDNLRNPLAPAPMYNIATKSAVQPGSTFKPVTASAGLYCGLDPNKTVVDGGYIDMGDRTFGCVLWNLFKQSHGSLALRRAIGVSCNYYFYDVATNKDWYSGGTMGYDKEMSVDLMTNFAEQYGLGLSTGIEIPETVVPVPTKERKIAGLKTNLSNQLYAAAEEYFTKDVVGNKKKLKKNVDTILSWMEEDVTREEMTEKLLPSVGVKKRKYEKITNLCLYTYFNQAKWNIGDAFNISIGQGENAYTPLQMANYCATLGNGGVHNQASVVKSVEDWGLTQKDKPKKVEVTKNQLGYIIDGMTLVCHGYESTVKKVFNNTGTGITFAGKTGTAQRSGKINPPSEVKYVKQYLGSWGHGLTWPKVKKEMKRLMDTYPETYTTEDTAVRRAVVNVSRHKVSLAKIDSYKPSYDTFAWMICMAPADDPKIAVAVMVPQGGTSANVAPIAKEVICSYLDEEAKSYSKFKIESNLN